MSKIFYIGEDSKVYGPVTQINAQRWYAQGFFNADVQFQISDSSHFNRNERTLSMGELIELNGFVHPFRISKDKVDREKQLEESLNQLTDKFESLCTTVNAKESNERLEEKEMKNQMESLVKEFESLRSGFTEKERKSASIMNEKISVLQSQIASLRESNTEFLQKLNVLSSKKESSPESSQLDKRMAEIRKKVDEQEKSLASMKKEISAINSKCDKNESKLDKLMEKQKDINESGYGKELEDLRSKEKSIRESINFLEKNAESTSKQLDSIEIVLSEVKKEMESTKKMPSVSAAVPSVEPSTERSADEIEEKAESAPSQSEKPTVAVKPPKNWDAICRELSDEEEEEKIPAKKTIPAMSMEERSGLFMRNFIVALGIYCAAVETGDFSSLKSNVAGFDLEDMDKFLLAFRDRESLHYKSMKTTLTKAIRYIADKTIYCCACDFTITNPRHLLFHLMDDSHIEKIKSKNQFTSEFKKFNDLIRDGFLKFAMSMNEINECAKKEEKMIERGRWLDEAFPKKSLYRPDIPFLIKFASEIMSHLPVFVRNCKENGKGGRLQLVEEPKTAEYKKGLAANIRSWLSCKKNAKKITTDFEKLFKDKMPACGSCKTIFESADEYFQHMTAYNHAQVDSTSFTLFLSIWKGADYWNNQWTS